jgi:hypothetical protein
MLPANEEVVCEGERSVFFSFFVMETRGLRRVPAGERWWRVLVWERGDERGPGDVQIQLQGAVVLC